jgi:hypothetical protein
MFQDRFYSKNIKLYKLYSHSKFMSLALIIILLIIAVIIAIVFIYYYNKFVLLGNRIENSLAQIDVQLKKRAD